MNTNTISPKKLKLLFFASFAYLFVMACGFTNPAATPDPGSPDAVRTSAAQTMIAQMTQISSLATPTPTLVTAQPTGTLSPSSTPFPTFTSVAPLPTWTPLPTNTFVPSPTPVPCNLAQFVADISIADGSIIEPGSVFIKTWRLKNIGSCVWTTEYGLFFVSGDKMNGSTLIALPKKVNPGETVDVSVELTAPTTNGTYLGNWQLRTPDGKTFGVGTNGSTAFWVKIVVVRTVYTQPYNFVSEACKGTWTSGAGTLPCPGQSTDANGFVQILTAPVLETSKTADKPALWVHPQFKTDGFIQVEYPDIQIYPGDKFVSTVGCLHNHPNCRVIFTLSYRDENGTIKTLGTWYEAYEGQVVPISIDLSTLAGKKLNFILRVDAWGNADADHAFWLDPHLEGPARLDAIPFHPGW